MEVKVCVSYDDIPTRRNGQCFGVICIASRYLNGGYAGHDVILQALC